MKRRFWQFLIPLAVVVFALVGVNSADATSAAWRALYWNNDTLSGAPALIRMEDNLNYNWGYGSPAPEIQVDYFSARWTTTVNLAAGTYRFTATSDDGMLVWVDGNQIVNLWSEHAPQTVSAEISLGAGNHDIRVDYFELRGTAVAMLDWNQVGAPPAPQPPGGQPGNQLTAVVQNVSRLNVRQIPGDFNSAVVGIVSRGETVALTGCRTADSKYIQLRLPTGAVGWVNQYYLAAPYSFNQLAVCDAGSGGVKPEMPLTGTIQNVSVLNVRQIPGDLYSTIVGKVVRGQTVNLTGFQSADGKYVQLRLPDGAVGWVNKYYVNSSAPMSSFAVWK